MKILERVFRALILLALLSQDYRHHGGSSIYGNFENAAYDLSFPDYLN